MNREEAASIIEERVRVTEYVESSYVDCVDIEALRIAIKALAQPDCADCKKHGGDWECDYNTCHKGMDTISRQAAIDALGEMPSVWTESEYELGSVSQWEADVEAIKDLPSVQPDLARDIATIIENEKDMRVILKNAQTERKTGRWEMKPDPYGFFDEIPVCSECGCTTKMREVYKFCPDCGADMRGEDE